MAFSSVVQWWEEWQLRILVLGSLGVQCYLAFFASARKSCIRLLFRFSIWLAYLCGDALAIYALATLFNRQTKPQYKTDSHSLEVLWAPILLIHLGGPVCISAYNIEDNELWRRHILTAASQVAVSIYVFCKSWPFSADRILLGVAILLFIFGVSKCFDKPLALKRASFNSLASSFYPTPRTIRTTSREVELEEYIQEAKDVVQRSCDPPLFYFDGESEHMDNLSVPDKLFVDFGYNCWERFKKFKSFWLLNSTSVNIALRKAVSDTFDLIYTKEMQVDNDLNRRAGQCDNLCSGLVWLVTYIPSIYPILLFHCTDKEAYRASDIKVTFVLLYFIPLLEISSKFSTMGVSHEDWHRKVAQHSLIGFLALNKRHTILMGIMECLQCKSLLDQYFCLKPCHSASFITDLVHSHVKDGWKNYIRDIESYWKFSDIRGHWTLDRYRCEDILRWSIEKPFEESVILWHMATEFCFHRKGITPYFERAKLSREISNYMMHLLFANPEMLMPGSRRSMFTIAYSELETILRGVDLSRFDEKQLTEMIIDKIESEQGFVNDAWALAQELMRLGGDKKMCEVIKGVWIEMLCFSAGRCRGYLHAKSLGTGGEYLTFVSLLLSHAGLETFVERQQRVQLRLPKEVRMHIMRVKAMKKEIWEAARNRVSSASTEVEVVIS